MVKLEAYVIEGRLNPNRRCCAVRWIQALMMSNQVGHHGKPVLWYAAGHDCAMSHTRIGERRATQHVSP